jgi:hypothetical protein
MTGGTLQLKAYGSENIYLNANPQISFFRSVFKRHTNFAMENIELPFEGTTTMTDSSNSTYVFKIKRYADLLGSIFLVVNLPTIYSSSEQAFQWIKNLGSMMVVSATLYIGSQKIEEIRGETINAYHRLCRNYASNLNYNDLIGHTSDMYNPTMKDLDGHIVYHATDANKLTPSILGRKLYIPIPFFFENNSGLYLPLVALQNTEVEIQIELRKINELYTLLETRRTEKNYGKRIQPDSNIPTQHILHFTHISALKNVIEVSMNTNYIFLDNDERKQFASNSHEYLIEQVQYKNVFGITGRYVVDMSFFHPTKEIRFFMRKSDASQWNQWSNFGNQDVFGEILTDGKITTRNELLVNNLRGQYNANTESIINGELSILKTAKFLMNGQERTREMDERYFRCTQPYQYHIGSTHYPFHENDHFNVFSFSLEPDNFQPSGSCNLTHLKSFQLELLTRIPPETVNFYMIEYSMVFDDSSYNSQWRDATYKESNASIKNVYTQYLTITSLDSNDSTNLKLYGRYIHPTTKVLYNIVISSIHYELNPNGTIQNNTIFLDDSLVSFYASDDIYYEAENPVVPGLIITMGNILFTYIPAESTTVYSLYFLNISVSADQYDTYINNISQTDFNTYTAQISASTQQPYGIVYKSLDDIITRDIQRTIVNPIVSSSVIPNTFQIVSFDFNNNQLYGILKTYIDGNITAYYCVCDITTPLINVINSVYTIPLTSGSFQLYDITDTMLETPIDGTPLVLDAYSIIIFSVKTIIRQNPDELKKYLWKYDLFIEAHNYNLLRIVSGNGAIAYST